MIAKHEVTWRVDDSRSISCVGIRFEDSERDIGGGQGTGEGREGSIMVNPFFEELDAGQRIDCGWRIVGHVGIDLALRRFDSVEIANDSAQQLFTICGLGGKRK